MPTVTAILIATGKLAPLQESIASFLAQDYADCKLVIVNNSIKQTLAYEHPRIFIYNPKSPSVPMRQKNWAVDSFGGDIVIAWDQQSAYMPDFLSSIVAGIEGKQWVQFDKEWTLDIGTQEVQLTPASEFSFAFTRDAYNKVGKYGPGVYGASDRNLAQKILRMFPGTPTPTTDPKIIRLGTKEQREQIGASGQCGVIKLQPAMRLDYASMVEISRTGKREKKLIVVLLGRYGDLINILPCLKWLNDLYQTPYVMVSAKFADLFDGISYANVITTGLDNSKLGQALEDAKRMADLVVNAQIWGEKFQGVKDTPSYNIQSWKSMGFLNHFNDPVRPVFDRRNLEREAAFAKMVRGDDTRPMILVNLSQAVSSPCGHCPALLPEIRAIWGEQNHVIDLTQFRAERIFDLLTLFEQAKVLISVDSAFLHLITATETPVVALVNDGKDGWGATRVRCGNAVSHIGYSEVQKDNRKLLHESIAAALSK